jgi:hypothetical protein
MSTTTALRFEGQHQGWPIVFLVSVPLLVVVVVAITVPHPFDLRALAIIGILMGGVPLGLAIWAAFQLQDIVTVETEARTMTVLHRRLLLPSLTHHYTGDDLSRVWVRKYAGDGADEYVAYASTSDRRQHQLTRQLSEQTEAEAAALRFRQALGRDDVPIEQI